MSPDTHPGTYTITNSNVTVSNNHSLDVFFLFIFCALISAVVAAVVAAVTTNTRRSSRSRKENIRLNNYDVEIDVERGKTPPNARHTRPSQSSPEWNEDSAIERTRKNNRRRQQQHRAATRVGGRRVPSPRRRRQDDGMSASRALKSLTTLLSVVNHVQCSQAEKDAIEAEYEAYTAAAGFVRDHGDPAHYSDATAAMAEQHVDAQALERELHELAAGFDLEVLQQDLEDMEIDAGGLNDSDDDDWAPPRSSVAQQQHGGGRRRRGRPRRPLQAHNIGGRTVSCPKCGSKLWKGEKSSICCSGGKATNLATHFSVPAPEPLRSLMLGTHPDSAIFKAAIRKFNNTLAMASSGLHSNNLPGISFLSTTGIGRVHHFLAPPAAGAAQPAFAQLYIIDNMSAELQARTAAIPWSVDDRRVLSQLQEMLHEHNHFVQEFVHMGELARQDNVADYHLIFKQDGTVDKRRYNAPTATELAGFMPGSEDSALGGHREFKMHLRTGNVQCINDAHPVCDPLHFVLFHPHGELGFTHNTEKVVVGPQRVAEGGADDEAAEEGPENSEERRKTLTIMESVKFFMHDRPAAIDNSLFVHGGKLYHEWLVDQYCKMENERLAYIRFHQKELRAECYQGMMDGVRRGETVGFMQGRRVVLPASFQGGPRHMAQCYQDAMALVRAFGKPDLFMTMTCNPKWEEINAELKPGQQSSERPDLVARVFHLKLNALLDDLKKGFLGRVVAHLHVVEFQKRGLPHAHILLFLAPEDKPLTAGEVDAIVSAEMPDPAKDKELYDIITECMLHGPCGAANPNQSCMVENECSKHFPKQFQEKTLLGNNAFPTYQRRDSGVTYMKSNFLFDNRWVVPYNPTLLRRYNCHINVEVCTSVKAVKYLFKYVYKGHDRAEIRLERAAAVGAADPEQARDEVKEWQDGRYVSACEAAWRLYGFYMHNASPNVVRLPVHLPNGQQVFFNQGQDLREALEHAQHTKLTAWFDLNKEKADFCAACPDAERPACLSTTYQEFPKIAIWKVKTKSWEIRKRGIGKPVGRMYHVMPSEGERYYLRLLLHHVPGATSFEHLRTVDGEVKETFKAACQALGLLADDAEWRRAMQAAAESMMPVQLRGLFASLLLFNDVASPLALWDEFKDEMADDIRHSLGCDDFNEVIYGRLLAALESLLQEGSRSLVDFGLPTAPHRVETTVEAEIAQYNPQQQAELLQKLLPLLNTEQRAAFDQIMASVRSGPLARQTLFFIDGIGGSGKTFLYTVLLAAVRSFGKLAIPVASSGIAALLLEGGRTAHSRFKIPVQGLSEQSTCYVSTNSPQAAMIRNAAIIIWDEAPMMHKHVFESVDKTFRDIMGGVHPSLKNKPFGGKVIVFGGDFRQVLPVVRRGRRAQVVAGCLNKSNKIWHHVQVITLHRNMRVERLLQENDPRAADLQAHADYLLSLGNGTEPGHVDKGGEEYVRVPPRMVCPGDTLQDLINEIYSGLAALEDEESRKSFIVERAILTPRNENVDLINNTLDRAIDLNAPGEAATVRKTYLSSDSVMLAEQEAIFPLEFLNSLEMSGVPPHKLCLQEGCPVILLRNMSGGLANGTRLIIKRLMTELIDAEVVTGPSAGTRVFIPRLSITPSDVESMPFTLRRRQFPVRPAWAMTINKSQGQTFKKVGMYLPKPVFSHGQLYVGDSRVGDPDGVKILVPGAVKDEDGAIYTANVVYKEVLLQDIEHHL